MAREPTPEPHGFQGNPLSLDSDLQKVFHEERQASWDIINNNDKIEEDLPAAEVLRQVREAVRNGLKVYIRKGKALVETMVEINDKDPQNPEFIGDTVRLDYNYIKENKEDWFAWETGLFIQRIVTSPEHSPNYEAGAVDNQASFADFTFHAL